MCSNSDGDVGALMSEVEDNVLSSVVDCVFREEQFPVQTRVIGSNRLHSPTNNDPNVGLA